MSKASHPKSEIFPQVPINRITAPFQRFMHVEFTSGVVLLLAAIAAIICANSPLKEAYEHLWHTMVSLHIGSFQFELSLHHIINDGLMTLFFLVVGMELKGELVHGELKDPRAASLPILAAAGGMLFPAIFYSIISPAEARHGWGIPTATDIAFVVGAMTLLGSRVPKGLRVMILTLAIADDMGAILVIALGYSTGVQLAALLAAFALLGLVYMTQKAGVRSVPVYIILGIAVWAAFYFSGVHATLAGVALGMMTPTTAWLGKNALSKAVNSVTEMLTGENEDIADEHRREIMRTLQKASRESLSPLERIIERLHPWVSFLIMPVFAFANAGVTIEPGAFASPVTLAVAAGLLLGKPVGIAIFSFIAIKLGLSKMPTGVTWPVLIGGGMLAGIGFTMALFVANLAFPGNPDYLANAKIGILAGTLFSALVGSITIILVSKNKA